MGLDQAMGTEWQKYTEINAVVPCTDKKFRELTKAGHVCIPTKWVLTDKTEHLRGTPEYVPKWKARLVACGNFEHIGLKKTSARIFLPQSLKESRSYAHGPFQLVLNSKQQMLQTHTSKGNLLKHPKGVPDPEIQKAGYMIARVPVHRTTDAGRNLNLYLRIKESCKEFGLRASQILSALYFITGEDKKLRAAICTHVDDFLWAATPLGEPVVQRLYLIGLRSDV